MKTRNCDWNFQVDLLINLKQQRSRSTRNSCRVYPVFFTSKCFRHWSIEGPPTSEALAKVTDAYFCLPVYAEIPTNFRVIRCIFQWSWSATVRSVTNASADYQQSRQFRANCSSTLTKADNIIFHAFYLQRRTKCRLQWPRWPIWSIHYRSIMSKYAYVRNVQSYSQS